MSSEEGLWLIGQLGLAWLLGFGIGVQWKKFRDAVYSASSLD